jgi:oxygen-dependent protoporphyrinogen oxidase
MTSVLVVGAGIAGLTAGHRLRQAGFQVTVAEAAPWPGGRMTERTVDGIAYNTGARLLYPFGAELHRLIGELGLAGALVPLRGLSAQYLADGQDDRLELMPGPASLLAPGLTLGERLRLARFALRLLALRPNTDPDDLLSAAAHDGETLAAYADRHLGPSLRARLLDPLFRGTRSWNLDDISPSFLLSTLPHLLGRRAVHVLAGGMGRLATALAAGLDVRCNLRARAVEPRPGGLRTHFDAAPAIDSDLVVLAVPGPRALALLADPAPEAAGFLRHVRYNSLGIVHYAVRGDLAPAMRFLRPDHGGHIATFQQLPAAGRPTAQIYCQLTPEATRLAAATGRTAALDSLIRPDLRRLLPDIDARETGRVEQWIEDKLPIPWPGYAAHLRPFRTWQAAAPRLVYLCGDYLRQPLVNGACASGAETAAAVIRHWRKV